MNEAQIDKLLIYDPLKSRCTIHVYIAHPSATEEKILGRLFILTEIESNERINQDIINSIQETVKNNYYQGEELSIETIFEQALEKTNQKIAELISLYETNWLDKTNIVIAILKDQDLHFSLAGKLNSFLIHGQKIIDIIHSTPDAAEEKINPLKTFSNIISGKLSEGDGLIFCTSSLLDYISQEKIRRMMIEQPAQEQAARLENILSMANETVAFGAIIIKSVPEQKSIYQPAINSAPAKEVYQAPLVSMDELIQKEETTQDLLTPSIKKYFITFFANLKEQISNFFRVKILGQSPRRLKFQRETQNYNVSYGQRMQEKRKNIVAIIFSGISYVLKNIFIGSVMLIKGIASLFSKKEEIASKAKSLPIGFKSWSSRLIIKFKNLNSVSKILLVIAVLILLIFSQSIVVMGKKGLSQQTQNDFAAKAESISQKITQAEAALSYGNEDGAKNILTEAQNILNSLPQKNQDQKNQVAELSNNLNIAWEKTKHITILENPKLITDFATLDANISIAGISLASTNIYAFSPADSSIYQVEVAKGNLTAFAKNKLASQFQYMTTQTTSTLLFLNTNYELNEFNITTKKLKPLAFSLLNKDSNIADMAVYQGRLYLLDIKNNQIYKSLKGSAGYGQPTNWLTDQSVSLQNARSLTVDGSIYVLMSNGETIKLTQGKKDDWSLKSIDPSLNAANKIFTDANTNNLYVLDTKGKRLVVFNKKGQFIDQYTSDKFDNLKDLAVNEKQKKAYLLNDAKLYEVDLNQ